MPREDILAFLRKPADFATGAQDPDVWRAALDEVAAPAMQAAGEPPLLPAQTRAWRGLAERRAGLILGPPGTGKTHLLSWLIAGYVEARRRAGLPCRVFVSAFTRNAAANVLEAVAKRQSRHFPGASAPLYVGNAPSAGVGPGVDLAADRAEVWQALSQPHTITGGTVWSLYALLTAKDAQQGDGFTAPLFDLVCLDEASQMVLGQGLMALAGLAPHGRVVVAGDDKQLPPIRALRSTVVGERELGGSLYAFLKTAGASEFALEETFRLNAPLTDFPQEQFYPGRYRSADPDRRLPLVVGWQEGLEGWMKAALDPEAPVVVFVHEGPSAATSSPFEARLIAKLAEALQPRVPTADGGLCPPDRFWHDVAAVVSPHRAQNALIRATLPDSLKPHAFVETVDRIQGKERDTILLSYCVADPEFALAEGDFIFSRERLNVAVTRSRSKLVVFVSRRLLESAPNDQETMDKVETLREFVYGCALVDNLILEGPGGQQVRSELRVRGFDGCELDLDLTDSAPAPSPPADKALTPELEHLLAAIQRVSATNRYGRPPLSDLKRELALPVEPYEACRELHRRGLIVLREQPGRYEPFWTAQNLAEPRRVFTTDEATVRARIAEVVRESRVRGALAPFYTAVRDRFVWMAPDKSDTLLPVLQRLQTEGLVRLGAVKGVTTVDVAREAAGPLPEPETLASDLDDRDFEVLNRLEDLEARRINFGVFDSWTHPVPLAASLRWPVAAVLGAVGRLSEAGYLMVGQDGSLRSRMGELAREVRYVKQRFRPDDAAKRPYLARSLKLEIRDRNKPLRNVAVGPFLQRLAAAHPNQAAGVTGVSAMLSGLWGGQAQIAGFQARGFEEILAAWRGDGGGSLVISADTGSGKTEAAVLPMIAAAAGDVLNGVRGVRAVLTYPRVRLVANQAQRLAGYLAALAQVPGMPVLTLGLQVAQTPRDFANLRTWDREAGWEEAGGGLLTFPFFACPGCRGPLRLQPRPVGQADVLSCTECDWRYAGWVGSKAGLIAAPPTFFLPTTDSLHQWLSDPQYGPLFGDADFAVPRLLMADEIHLYTHIHGAQVGMALRRLLARAALNGQATPVAVGMSATLGDPARAWARLTGRTEVGLVQPQPAEQEINSRGREYFLFVQPEVESRGKDVAGPSTTIQSLMCLAHGMRRRTGDEGGFRSLAFIDSIDKVRRLHSAYMDAEEGSELFVLRTASYGDGPDGHPQTECCGRPQGCDRFGDGECWWFAAQDDRQRAARGRLPRDAALKVSSGPVYSGTGGAAERIIKESDIVFATSSLEVGYDDPDITLVYQHYAPSNLASFIQRKGRGGRGVADRPITAVTLSIYSPRDSWWFRRPHEMIAPQGFETPLNPDNFFVRRGQALCALLDGLARRAAQGRPIFHGPSPTDAALAEAEALAFAALGPDLWPEFGCADVRAFWTAAMDSGPFSPVLPELRAALDWAPNALFDTINLPSARVSTPESRAARREGTREDVSLLLHTVAPGNASRRFDAAAVHWRPPVQGLAPWFDPQDYQAARSESLSWSAEDLLEELPAEARPTLAGLQPRICRPVEISLERLGRMAGADYVAEWSCDPAAAAVAPTPSGQGRDPNGVHHESRGQLRGFLLVEADAARAEPLALGPISPLAASLTVFRGDAAGRGATGLRVSRVYWGADADLRLEEPGSDSVSIAQTFAGPRTQTPLLHGYRVETEGLRLQVRAERLDAFVAAERARLANNDPERRWRLTQFTRFLIESRAQYAGVNAYEARRGADLVVAAAGDPELRAKLLRLLQRWDGGRLAELFEETRAKRLAQNPLLTTKRVAKTAEALSDQAFQLLLDTALKEAAQPQALEGYLRSLVLHGLALRLKDAFIRLGHSDERGVLTHVKLPIQFGGASDDIITLCEAGASGDGTTRGVAAAIDTLLEEMASGEIAACPNAAEDALVCRFWAAPDQHEAWRAADPRDVETVRRLARDLGADPELGVPASLLRILYSSESIGSDDVDLYDLAREIEAIRAELEGGLGRQAQDWELASAAVAAAQARRQPTLARVHAGYAALDDAAMGESLSADARLADQVYRIGARLCVDGCRACVHQGSDLMSDSLTEVSVSRQVLGRFLEG